MSEFSTNPEVLVYDCPSHGGYYSDKTTAFVGLQRLAEAGLDEAQVADQASREPALADALRSTLTIADALAIFGEQHAPMIRRTLARSKTTEITPVAEQLADELVAQLGRPPDLVDINAAVMGTANLVAFLGRRVARTVQPEIESGIVNQFTASLLVRCNRDTLCHTPFPSGDQTQLETALDRQVQQTIAGFRMQYPGTEPILPNFLRSKQRNLAALTTMAYNLHTLAEDMPTVELSGNELHMLGENNTELAKQTQRLRHYGVASVAFDTSELLPGTEAIYDEYDKLGINLFIGELPWAVIRLVPSDTAPEQKFQYTKTTHGTIERLDVVTAQAITVLSVDHKGELHAGHSPQTNSIPLRQFFAAEQKEGAYEYLRAVLLGHLFDATAPAEVVNRIIEESRPTSGANPTDREVNNIVTRLLLPRIRYMSGKSMKDIRAAVAEAQADDARAGEDEETIGGRRWHEVGAFLRWLPENAKGPSVLAMQRAKEHFGDDFEMPPGRTFVKRHPRGNEERGRVLGRTATPRQARIEE